MNNITKEKRKEKNEKRIFIRNIFLIAFFYSTFIISCENQWMIDILDRNKSGEIEIEGGAEIIGDYKIGGKLTVDLSKITFSEDEPEGYFLYQWKAGDSSAASGAEYTIKSEDAEKIISCVITHSGANGSVTALYNDGEKVPFTLKLEKQYASDSLLGDDIVSFNNINYPAQITTEITANNGDEITISYTVDDISVYNELSFNFGITGASVSGDGTALYIVSSSDAVDGIITIIAAFRHSDISIGRVSNINIEYDPITDELSLWSPDADYNAAAKTITISRTSSLLLSVSTYDTGSIKWYVDGAEEGNENIYAFMPPQDGYDETEPFYTYTLTLSVLIVGKPYNHSVYVRVMN